MYNNQLIKRTIENKPANEYLHGQDNPAWLPRLPGHLGSCSWTSAAAPSWEWSFHMFCAWVLVSGCLFPQATCFTSATILEEGTTVKRRPSGFGSDAYEFVWKYLSKDIEGEMMPWVHMHQKCLLRVTKFRVMCHAPKQFAEKIFMGLYTWTRRIYHRYAWCGDCWSNNPQLSEHQEATVQCRPS